MLKNNKFGLSEEIYQQFREVLRTVVEELKKQESLYAQALGEYLNQLGKILFTGDTINEKQMVSFMALVTEFLINKEVDVT